jgi:UDP-glucose 4-epimerase
MTNLRVAVTGASGNVGTALLRAIGSSQPDWSVVGVCRRPPHAGTAAYDAVSWRACDIAAENSGATIAEAFRGADAVVHAAWLIQPSRDRRLLDRTNVDGTRRVVEAARAAGVAHLVHMSSVGAYSPSDKRTPRDESWSTDGVPGSLYSRHKVAAERVLDDLSAGAGMAVARLRPGLIFQRDAGSEVARYFLGSLVPQRLLGGARVPVLPVPDEAVFQAVHADDVADALVRVLERRASGPFNLAAEPVITPERLAEVFGARRARLSASAVRAAAGATYRLRLQPTEPGWVDLAFAVPVMSIRRAAVELGWKPAWSSIDALRDLLAGMRDRAGTTSPAMHPRRRLSLRP